MATAKNVFDIPPGVVKDVPIDLLNVDILQPRKEFDDAFLKQLAADIERRGVQQPVRVRYVDGKIIIKQGEQRFRASRLAGKNTVPCILADEEQEQGRGDLDLFTDQISENHQRAPLNTMDWCHALTRMRDDFKLGPAEIEKHLQENGVTGMSRPYISNLLRLGELPDWAQQAVREGKITGAHGKHILTVIKYPEALKRVKQYLEKGADEYGNGSVDGLDRDVQPWDFTVEELGLVIMQACSDAFVDIDGYGLENPKHRGPLNGERRLFKDTPCKACPIDALFVVTNGKAKARFCTKPAEFWKKQEEVKVRAAARKEKAETAEDDRDGGRKDAPTPAEIKARKKRSADQRNDRIATHLDEFLREHLKVDVLAKHPDTVRQLVVLCAIGLDGERFYGGMAEHDYRDECRKVRTKIKLTKFDALLKFKEGAADMLEIARWCVDGLDDPEVLLLAHHLNVKLAEVYEIDEDYLACKTKDEVEALLKKAGVEYDDQVQTAADFKEVALEAAEEIGIPDDVAKIYAAGGK